MRGTIVGVLRGGPSREHDVSLKTGHAILQHLPTERFTARDIFIDKQGFWHERGRPTTPASVLSSVDVVVNGLHGEYGEDGEVQKLLETFGVPYTGSDSFASYLAIHKLMSKHRVEAAGLLTPRYLYIEVGGDVDAIAHAANRSFLQPVVVKAVKWGSSVGVTLAHGFANIQKAIRDILDAAGGVLIEERIRGREATVGVIEEFRGETLYTLPPVEIIPPSAAGFFSYDAKYSGETLEIVPGRFTKKESAELQKLAKQAHEALGLRHYSRSDFIVSPKGIYYLETNTLPGLTDQSLMPKSLASVGASYPDFLSHLVDLALRKR